MGDHLFEKTQWDVVHGVYDPDLVRAAQAWERLCRSYWYRIYAYLRRHGYGPEDAEDLVQGFSVHLRERDILRKANPERGRFRCFVLSCLRHFMADQQR